MTELKVVAKLRALADAMQKDIDAKLAPAISQQNLTPRRIRIAESMRRDGRRLELVQRAMRRMADYHEAGSAGVEELAARFTALATRKSFEELPSEVLEQIAGGPREETPAEKVRKQELELVGLRIPGFFPTPPPVIEQMLALADVGEGMRVLEPSAGKGDIADAIRTDAADRRIRVTVDCIEIAPRLRDLLEVKAHRVLLERDILRYRPTFGYDRILMNPPFERALDIQHVVHCFDLLAPGGRLVAVMGEGAFFKSDSVATDFREWLDERDGRSAKLPAGSFTGRGVFVQTGVASRLVVIDKATCTDDPVTDPVSDPVGESA